MALRVTDLDLLRYLRNLLIFQLLHRLPRLEHSSFDACTCEDWAEGDAFDKLGVQILWEISVCQLSLSSSRSQSSLSTFEFPVVDSSWPAVEEFEFTILSRSRVKSKSPSASNRSGSESTLPSPCMFSTETESVLLPHRERRNWTRSYFSVSMNHL